MPRRRRNARKSRRRARTGRRRGRRTTRPARRLTRRGGKRVLVNRAYPSRRRQFKGVWKRPTVRELYTSSHHSKQKCQASYVSRVIFFADQMNAGARTMEFTAYLSDCMRLSTTTPAAGFTCPQFYECIRGWQSFTMTGMKMEIFVMPHILGEPVVKPAVVAGSTAYQQEPAWIWHLLDMVPYSRVTEGVEGTPTVMIQAGPAPALPTVSNSTERAQVDPSYRTHKGSFPCPIVSSTTHIMSMTPRRIFKRYVKVSYDKKIRLGMNAVVNTTGSAIPTDAPVITPTQNEQVFGYVVPAIFFQYAGAVRPTGLFVNYTVRKTFYFTCYDRLKVDLSDVPLIERPVAQEASYFLGGVTPTRDNPAAAIDPTLEAAPAEICS